LSNRGNSVQRELIHLLHLWHGMLIDIKSGTQILGRKLGVVTAN
jgi:hypothetical protein